jgi:APA family basic amino acid/polyamine antiporter
VGGPYAWTRQAFGELPAFLVGWGYWISCWCGQAAIAIAMVCYLGALWPGALEQSSLVAIVAMGLLCAVNLAGVREAGLVQLLTTILKVLPLLAIAIFGFTHFEPAHFEPFNPSDEPLPHAVLGALALTLWAFQGFEAASVTGDEVDEPERNIPRATLIGIALATVLYVAATLSVMGLVEPASLAKSSAPFADAATQIWGAGAGRLVALGAFISCFGALNGWILVAGRLPYAMARDGLFPKRFGELNAKQTPAGGLVLSTGLACVLVLTNYQPSLVAMFTTMTLLATLSALLPLVVCALADWVLTAREGESGGRLVDGLALLYGALTFFGAGGEALVGGLALLAAGLPVYGWMRRRAVD